MQQSQASHQTQKILDTVSQQSSIKLFKMQGELNEEVIQKSWAGVGQYIQKQLRTGRAVNVPKLGLFTFTEPEITLKVPSSSAENDPIPRAAPGLRDGGSLNALSSLYYVKGKNATFLETENLRVSSYSVAKCSWLYIYREICRLRGGDAKKRFD